MWGQGAAALGDGGRRAAPFVSSVVELKPGDKLYRQNTTGHALFILNSRLSCAPYERQPGLRYRKKDWGPWRGPFAPTNMDQWLLRSPSRHLLAGGRAIDVMHIGTRMRLDQYSNFSLERAPSATERLADSKLCTRASGFYDAQTGVTASKAVPQTTTTRCTRPQTAPSLADRVLKPQTPPRQSDEWLDAAIGLTRGVTNGRRPLPVPPPVADRSAPASKDLGYEKEAGHIFHGHSLHRRHTEAIPAQAHPAENEGSRPRNLSSAGSPSSPKNRHSASTPRFEAKHHALPARATVSARTYRMAAFKELGSDRAIATRLPQRRCRPHIGRSTSAIGALLLSDARTPTLL